MNLKDLIKSPKNIDTYSFAPSKLIKLFPFFSLNLFQFEKRCVISHVQVTMCANTVKRYWLAMAVDVEGVGKEIGTLPINARSDTIRYVSIH